MATNTQLHTHNTWSTYVRTAGVTYGRIRAVGGSRKAAVTAVHQVKHGCIKGTKCHVFTVKLRKCSYVKAFAFESLLSRRVQQILLNQLYDENMVIKRHRNRGYYLLNSTKCKYLFWDLLLSAAPNTSWVFGGGGKVKTLYFHESPLILNHHVSIAFFQHRTGHGPLKNERSANKRVDLLLAWYYIHFIFVRPADHNAKNHGDDDKS